MPKCVDLGKNKDRIRYSEERLVKGLHEDEKLFWTLFWN